MNEYDIAIIGAGAAGCMAAIFASTNKKVVLIERNHQIGKKILATGNGRCNITNININTNRYHGSNEIFMKNVFSHYNQHETMEYFNSLGLMLKEEDKGRIFPRSNQASSVTDVLLHELDRNEVTIKYDSLVRSIEKNSHWVIKLESSETIYAHKLIIATGGKAAHQFGSSGDGYYWAKQLGHTIIETYPALAPIEIKETWIKQAQGVKIDAFVKTTIEDKILSEQSGDVLFTHFGLSGPAVMSQARYITPNLDKNIKISIDLFPDSTEKELDNEIKYIFDKNGAKSVKNCLIGAIPIKLIELILNQIEINPDKKSAELSKKDRLKIVESLKNIELTPKSVRSFKEAQVTRGGIDTKELDSNTLESKLMPNLYFAGEILDVDGDSGGFNLQWAWSTGYLAGISSSK